MTDDQLVMLQFFIMNKGECDYAYCHLCVLYDTNREKETLPYSCILANAVTKIIMPSATGILRMRKIEYAKELLLQHGCVDFLLETYL